MMQFSPYSSSIPLDFAGVNFIGFPMIKGIKQGRGAEKQAIF